MLRLRQGSYQTAIACLLILFAAAILAGCGGGSGTSTPSTFTLRGRVSNSLTRSVTRASLPAGVTVNGYLWPDLTTVVATATTDANGYYVLTYPASSKDKAAVVVVVAGSGSTSTRYSLVVGGLTGNPIVDANIDPATSLTAELVLASALTTPASASISPSSVATIYHELIKWSGIDAADLTVNGTTLPSALGSGLKSASNAATFLSSDIVVTESLKSLSSTSTASVAGAKSAVQMVRSFFFGITDNARSEISSIQTAYDQQRTAVTNASNAASAFKDRLKLVEFLINDSPVESLTGAIPGNYTYKYASGVRALVRTGNSFDGKSWVVTSMLGDATNGQVATFTPTNAIPVFKYNADAGTIALTVRNASDSALAYNAQLTAIKTGPTPTTVTFTANLADAVLTQPIVASGTLNGVPTTGEPTNATGPYTKLSFSGSITSQWGQAQVTNLQATWTPSKYVQDIGKDASNLQKITCDSITASTKLTPSASLTISGVEVDFDLTGAYTGKLPKLSKVTFAGEFKASGYDLTVSNFVVNFGRVNNSNPPANLPTSAQGQVKYTSPQLSITGNTTANWTNPSQNISTAGQFPIGSIQLTGSLTVLATSAAYGIDLTLTGSQDAATNAGIATWTLNSVTLGSQSVSGSLKATYPVVNGQYDFNNGASFVANITHQPSGDVLTMTGPAHNFTGTIKSSSGVKIADINMANQLQLNDLGTISIIKYTDGTFESAASIFP